MIPPSLDFWGVRVQQHAITHLRWSWGVWFSAHLNLAKLHIPVVRYQACSQNWLGGCRTPQKGTFILKKEDFLNLTPPPTLLQKPHFWSILWPKMDLSADLGGASHPLAMGLLDTKFMLTAHLNILKSDQVGQLPEEVWWVPHAM